MKKRAKLRESAVWPVGAGCNFWAARHSNHSNSVHGKTLKRLQQKFTTDKLPCPVYVLQGDTSGCSPGFVDIKIKVVFLYRLCTGQMGWMAHRKWKEAKQLPSTAGPGNMLGCSLISFHFLWAIHPIRPVGIPLNQDPIV